jgi:DDE superfamily endonuclease
MVTAAVYVTTLESPADVKRRSGKGKTRRLQKVFADHLRHVGRLYPKGKHPRVELIIDNAPWHTGESLTQALADNPYLELYRLPSYSPQLNVMGGSGSSCAAGQHTTVCASSWPT